MKLSTPSGEHVLISGIKLVIAVNHTIPSGEHALIYRYKTRYCSRPLNPGISEMWPANFVSLKLTDFNL